MDLEALRAQARAVATRMETRLNTALGENRDLTAEEEAANTADEAELAGLKGQIATAEQAASAPGPDAVTPAVTAERARILALADLCPSSVVASSLRAAIDNGTDAGAFAISLAQAAKTRGATMQDLRDGAVQASELPAGKKEGSGKPLTGAARGSAIVAKAAALGHKAAAHLIPKS